MRSIACEPKRTARRRSIPRAATFRGNTIPGGGDAHVGIGLSESFLNHAGYGIFDSGMLCIGAGTRLSQQLSTGLFSLLIGSIRPIVFPDLASPLAISVRPQQPPTFEVGMKGQRRLTTWNVMYGRSYIPSFGFGGTVQNEEVRVSLHAPMGRRFELDGTVAYRQNDSLDIAEADLEGVSAQGSFGYAPTRWLRLEVFAIHSFQDSQLAGGQISRTQAGVRFRTLYPMRLR